MPNMPEGSQLSDDGQWRWDGSDWQPASGVGVDSGGSTPGDDGPLPEFPYEFQSRSAK
jgi:hypothetical protein